MADHVRTENPGRPGSSRVARPLTGLLRALLALLLVVAAAMLVTGLVIGYWPLVLASLPFAVFAVATAKSIQARFEAKYLLLSDASALQDNLHASQPGFRRAAGWAVVALVALGAAAAVLQSGA